MLKELEDGYSHLVLVVCHLPSTNFANILPSQRDSPNTKNTSFFAARIAPRGWLKNVVVPDSQPVDNLTR